MARRHYVTTFLNLTLLSTLCSANCGEIESCRATEQHPYVYMATRTSYDFVRGNVSRISPDSSCKPLQIWALVRHGTRYPEEEILQSFTDLPGLRDEIIKNHDEKGRGHLCPQDLENLRRWSTMGINGTKPNSLSLKGMADLRNLARRLRDAFPELLNVNPLEVSQSDFIFRSTKIQRAKYSMEAFMYELLQGIPTVKPARTPKKDTLLYLYKNCPGHWTKQDIMGEQRDEFQAGPEYRCTQRKISERLGFNRTMEPAELKVLYDICRFQLALHTDRPSAWCAAFDTENLRVMEYIEDLNRYYTAGPGRPEVNVPLGCPTLHDMIKHFRNLEQKESANKEPKGVFYFSHTSTLQAMMTAMGLGKESPPLLGSNYEQKRNRKFRTSFSGSFASNIIGVFYKCEDKKSPHKVMLYEAERLLKLDGCDEGVCDWEHLKQKFSHALDKCDLRFCNRKE